MQMFDHSKFDNEWNSKKCVTCGLIKPSAYIKEDPIRKVYNKYNLYKFPSILSLNLFERDMWEAIKSYCEGK